MRKEIERRWQQKKQPANSPPAPRSWATRLSSLTLKQAKELSDYLEERPRHQAGRRRRGDDGRPGRRRRGGAAAEAKTEFDVILEGFGDKKIGVIKVVRAATPGPEGSQGLVEGVPSKVKEGISKEDAEKLKKELEEAGATVSIK